MRALVVGAAILLVAAMGGCSARQDGATGSSDVMQTSGQRAGEEGVDTEEADMPDGVADLKGRVVSVEPAGGSTRAAGSGAEPSGVLVEADTSSEPATGRDTTMTGAKGSPDKGERYLLRLKIAPETRMLMRRRGSEGEDGISEASVEDLAPEQAVEVWHSPETGRSYPAQARAHTILIR